MEALQLLFTALLLIGFTLLSFLKYRNEYWTRRGVVHDTPKLFKGNLGEVGKTQAFRDPLYDFYMKYKNQAPFGGFYLTLRAAVVIFDLELVKNILVKDFINFAHRGNYYNEKDDPLTGHLFNLDGPKWKKLRSKLTPTFSSGKMKFMFPTIVEVATRFVDRLQEIVTPLDENSEKTIEMRELLARFTTDVIANCAFGLECNSLEDPQVQFRVMGKRAFGARRHGRFIMSFASAFPDLARKLHIKMVPEEVSEFFLEVVRNNVEMRERENINKKDFMNLLMELRRNNETEGLSIEEIAAQAFVFFLAGFETSSSTMGFALYELALNQEIQDKARSEINQVLADHNGDFTYEAMKELKYLTQIFQETLRKHSIASLLLRKTIQDYPVPDTDQVIEAGTIIVIPVDAIHRDPDIYPDPDIFDPNRFTQDEIQKRHSMSWLPFGEGPRNCVGLRFGEMQAIIGLAMLLKNFRFTPSNLTKIPLEIDKKNFILASKDGIHLNVERIN